MIAASCHSIYHCDYGFHPQIEIPCHVCQVESDFLRAVHMYYVLYRVLCQAISTLGSDFVLLHVLVSELTTPNLASTASRNKERRHASECISFVNSGIYSLIQPLRFVKSKLSAVPVLRIHHAFPSQLVSIGSSPVLPVIPSQWITVDGPLCNFP